MQKGLLAWETSSWGTGTLQPAPSATAGPCGGFPWASVQGSSKALPQARDQRDPGCHNPAALYSPPQNIINAAHERSLI